MRKIPPSIRRAPRAHTVLAAAAAAAVVGLLAYGLSVTVGLPGDELFYRHWLYGALFPVAVLVFLLRAAVHPGERGAWLVFAAATTSHLLGWVAYWLFVEGDPTPVYPSVADGFWLIAYVGNYYALVLLVRARVARFRRALLIDGMIVVLSLAAVSGTVAIDRIVATTGGSSAAVLTSLAYPVGDLVVMAMVVTVFALSGWRPERSWAIIGAAFAILFVADSIYLYQIASGTWEQGTLVDLAWPFAPLLVAAAAWVRVRPREELELEGWRTLVVPAVFTLLAVALLVYGDLARVAPVGAVLATATLLVATVRCVIAFRTMLQLAESHERALDAALSDSLTGLRNHRAFQESLEAALDNSSAGGAPVCLVMLDLVGLKGTNDTHGHQAGDERLKLLAAKLLGVLRGGDACYRVGGDEFAILLPGVQAWDGFNVGVRLQRALSDEVADAPAVSIGVAEGEPGVSKDVLIGRADGALVEAKRSHRKIVLYSEGLELERGLDASVPRVHTKTLATALARAVDAKDAYTRSHCETVAETCVVIASGLGLGPKRVSQLRLAGLLHDVGKIGIPDTILRKPGPLTSDEWEAMKTHSRLGHSIVSSAGLEQEASWILHHHERPDGWGYPDGLRGDEIPLESRVILVADAFEAMTSDRPYRRGRPEADALAELRRHTGTQFDPDCVAALEQALQGAADVARGVEERRGHDAEEDGRGGEQNGHGQDLGLGSRVGLG